MSAKPTFDGTEQKRLNFDVPAPLAREFKAYAAPKAEASATWCSPS